MDYSGGTFLINSSGIAAEENAKKSQKKWRVGTASLENHHGFLQDAIRVVQAVDRNRRSWRRKIPHFHPDEV
jgi:hypothetical protein